MIVNKLRWLLCRLSVLCDQRHFHAKSFEMILCNAIVSARGWFYGHRNCDGHKIRRIIKNYYRKERNTPPWSKFHAKVSISSQCPMQSRPIRTHRFWTVLSKYAKMKRCLQIKQINRYFSPTSTKRLWKIYMECSGIIKEKVF